MFEAIVAAATKILGEDGMKSFTTNHIAERAGVGIASVYRYFADKRAIIAEIDRRNRRANAETTVAAFAAFENDFAAAIRAALRSFLETDGARGKTRRTLMTEVPLAWVAANAAQSFELQVAAASAALRRLRPDLPPDLVRLRLYLALHAVAGVAVGTLVFPLQGLKLDATVREMERAVSAIVLADP